MCTAYSFFLTRLLVLKKKFTKKKLIQEFVLYVEGEVEAEEGGKMNCPYVYKLFFYILYS